VRVDVPEDPALAAWLGPPEAPSAEPRQGRKLKPDAEPVIPTTLVCGVAGRPYSEDGLAVELRNQESSPRRSQGLGAGCD
jgi:hypothetical protein